MQDTFASILALLYFANARTNAVQAVLRYSANRRLVEFASERYIGKISAKRMYSIAENDEDRHTKSETERYEYVWRVWWHKDLFWRMDRLNLDNQTLQTDFIDEKKTITRSEHDKGINRSLAVNKAASEFAAFDPSFLLSSHDLSLIDEVSLINRKGYRLLAKPRPDREAVLDKLFWSAADSYEVIVDAASGILLGYTAYLNQHPFAKVTVEEFGTNVLIPKDIHP